MNLTNLILNTDSYKLSHYLQYPPETRAISSYVEARGHSDQAASRLWLRQGWSVGLVSFCSRKLQGKLASPDSRQRGFRLGCPLSWFSPSQLRCCCTRRTAE